MIFPPYTTYIEFLFILGLVGSPILAFVAGLWEAILTVIYRREDNKRYILGKNPDKAKLVRIWKRIIWLRRSMIWLIIIFFLSISYLFWKQYH